MGFKKWCVREFDKTLAKELSNELNIDPIVALIASSRGYKDGYELEEFLSDELNISSPFEIKDMDIAADIINEYIKDNKKIAVYGDYDCDGVTATALLYSYLTERNADCIYYIPDRFTEGYGMNCDAVKSLAEKGAELIITVDNGIVCFDEIELANSLGIKVIVTDHHLTGDKLPNALAVVNPHRKDSYTQFRDICGAEVAFKLVCAIDGKEPEELLPLYADLLATAVIADVMPLTGENRAIVKYGIEKLKTNPSVGLAALMNVASTDKSSINSSKIAFTICPRINAAGRMGNADRAVELLLSKNMLESLKIADEIDRDNSKRQSIEKEIFNDCVNIIERDNLKYDRVIVVCGDNWHHGVIGIVAAKITEKYGCPAILLSFDGDTASGSGRSIEGFNLYDAIYSSQQHLLKFGGHSSAAGISLKYENIPKFRQEINRYALSNEFVAPLLNIDLKLKPEALSLDLAFAINELEPFGNSNPTPLFGVYGVKLLNITPLSNNKHLRLSFSKDEASFNCMLFGVSTDNFCFDIGDILDLAVNIEPNLYKGEYSVSVFIKALRKSGTDDEKLFYDISNYNAFCSGNPYDTKNLFPLREEIGEVYKYICKTPVLPDKIKYFFLDSLGYSKTMIALKTMEELDLIEIKDGKYVGIKDKKTNLLNSATYKILSGRSDLSD